GRDEPVDTVSQTIRSPRNTTRYALSVYRVSRDGYLRGIRSVLPPGAGRLPDGRPRRHAPGYRCVHPGEGNGLLRQQHLADVSASVGREGLRAVERLSLAGPRPRAQSAAADRFRREL